LSPKNIAKIPSFLKQLGSKKARDASLKWKSLESGAKGDAYKVNMLNFAKDKGLTTEEASVLMKSLKFIENLQRVAKKSPKYKEVAKRIKN